MAEEITKFDAVLEGLKIIRECEIAAGNRLELALGHEYMYAGTFEDTPADKAARLEELGWFEDEDSWCIFI